MQRAVAAGASWSAAGYRSLGGIDEAQLKRDLAASCRVLGATGQGDAARDLLFKLPKLARGPYRVRVTLRAETNPARATTFTRTFAG